MVLNNQKQPVTKVQKKNPTPKDSAVTILTSGCHFDGKLYCRGASRIGGRIDGQIISEGLLIVEEEAMITAAVKVDETVIQGSVKWKLEATGRVELTHTCKFEGDIATPSLVIHEGAKFNGRCFMMLDKADRQNNKLFDAGPNLGGTQHLPDNDEKQPEITVLKVNG
jgi:cytoskeletal protein CcmA (bactofilin family)